MISKTLWKLIKKAFIPALVLCGLKIFTILVLVVIFNYDCETNLQIGIPPITFIFAKDQEAFLVNSYSNLITFILILLGVFWIVVKAQNFHETHITPKMSIKLAKLNLMRFIQSSFEIYHEAVAWFAFMWVSVIISFLEASSGKTMWWIFFVSLVVSVFMTYLLVEDIEREYHARHFSF